jgi:predicted enzyme related to lactoylglutathione lyase
MARVTGIGGVFFKARDAEALRAWYRTHLGIEVQPWGGASFSWREPGGPGREGSTVWSIFPSTTEYFAPSEAPFMINYRVANLTWILAQLRAEGCTVDDRIEDSEFGRFGWVMDPEGNRIELWEPPRGD